MEGLVVRDPRGAQWCPVVWEVTKETILCQEDGRIDHPGPVDSLCGREPRKPILYQEVTGWWPTLVATGIHWVLKQKAKERQPKVQDFSWRYTQLVAER